MIKYLLFLSVMMVSMSSQAQVPGDYPVESIPENGPTNSQKKGAEDQMIFFRFGQSVGKLDETRNVKMNSLGYIRYNDEFIYGMEYSSYFAEKIDTRANLFQVVTGYRHVWSKRVIPYALAQFGVSNFSGMSSSSGISTTLDVGVDAFKYNHVKGSFGVRKSFITSDDKIFPDANFTDLYVMIGFVW